MPVFQNTDGYAYEPVPAVSAAPPYPPDLVAKSRDLFAGTLELVRLVSFGPDLAKLVALRYPLQADRARTAAALVGVNPQDLLLANLCYDLLLGFSGMGCSTMALAGDGGPVLARNMDWFPVTKVARASCLIAEDYGVNAGFLGMIGAVTGLSKNGFCVCLNATFGGADPDGYPMLLFLRHVLDTAASFAQALELVSNERLMSGGIITLVGTRNDERAMVERTPADTHVRMPKADEPLLATNHYRHLAKPEGCSRYDHLAAHAGKQPPMDVLTNRNVLQTITAQHIVMCPAKQTAEMFVPTRFLADDAVEELSIQELIGFFTG